MEAAPPDLLFLDVQMPGMNGFQVLKAMRARGALARVPVVLLSAIGSVTGENYDPDMIEERYGVRPDAFVPKPIEPGRVEAALEQFLQ
jgi:CheY-like chemotaxis protein